LRYPIPTEIFNTSIELAFSVITSQVPHLRLICYCVRFFRTLFIRWEAPPDQFISVVIDGISQYRENDSVLSELLICLHRFSIDRSILPLLLECARLTDRDCEEYELNPSLFVSTVYSTSRLNKCAPRIYAAILIGAIVESDPCSLSFLLGLECEEVLMRIFAIICSGFAKLVTFHAWVLGAIEISTKQYLLSKCCHSFPEICDSLVCELLNEHSPLVVQICCCKLLKSMGMASPQAIAQFLQFLPQCPTWHAMKALHAIGCWNFHYLASVSEIVLFIAENIIDRWRKADDRARRNLRFLRQILQCCPDYVLSLRSFIF
jgi:hypothetical protein